MDRMKGQRQIFLDITCFFFKGVRRDYAEEIVLNASGFSVKTGIDNLIEKSLITIKNFNILWMHDLVEKWVGRLYYPLTKNLENVEGYFFVAVSFMF